MELISVIIIAYNVENYIQKCLESVINQTYKNLEIIIVDDASTDRTEDICIRYQKKDSRIKYVKHKYNKGQAISRNTGLDNANGEYISFIDSDDYVSYDYYEILYNNLKNTNSDISICNFIYVNEGEECTNAITTNNIKVYEGDDKYYDFFIFLRVQFLVAWGKIYRKKIFINLRYIPNSSNEDSNMVHKILAKAKKVVYTSKEMYFYLKRQGSITNNSYKIERLDVMDGEFDRVIFFKNVLDNERLYEMALLSFCSNIITNCYKLEEKFPEHKHYKQQLIKKYDYDIISQVLSNAKRLEGKEKEYNEDFDKFDKLNIPIQHIYRKVAYASSSVDIQLIKHYVNIMKVSYKLGKKDDRIMIGRMFFENSVANWEAKEGLEITAKSTKAVRKLKIIIFDTNDIWWSRCINLTNNYCTIKMPFDLFQIDEGFKMEQQECINLKRIKTLAVILEATSQHECGDIFIKNIKVY